MKYEIQYPPTKIEKQAGTRRCRNIACNYFIDSHQEQFATGYCTEWCKEMGVSRQRQETCKKNKTSRRSKLLEFINGAKTNANHIQQIHR